MAHYLPPILLALFTPRPPLPFVPPEDKPEYPDYTGVGAFLEHFKDPSSLKSLVVHPTPAQVAERRKAKAKASALKRVEIQRKRWDPASADPEVTTEDPKKTLFISRLDYKVDETQLRAAMKRFGVVTKLRIVKDRLGDSRGYAFVEFEDPRDVEYATKYANATKIGSRVILCEAERGRRGSGWFPRRLAGGRGDTRAPKLPKAKIEELRKQRMSEDRRSRGRSEYRGYSRDRMSYRRDSRDDRWGSRDDRRDSRSRHREPRNNLRRDYRDNRRDDRRDEHRRRHDDSRGDRKRQRSRSRSRGPSQGSSRRRY